jgi:hypothetical protein
VSLQFLADADLNRAIVCGVRHREPAISFLQAHDAGLHGLPDPMVLGLAAQAGRILVSHDISTMPAHFLGFLQEGRRSPGVVLVSQEVPVRDAIEGILTIWSVSWPSEMENQIVYIPSLTRHVFRS